MEGFVVWSVATRVFLSPTFPTGNEGGYKIVSVCSDLTDTVTPQPLDWFALYEVFMEPSCPLDMQRHKLVIGLLALAGIPIRHRNVCRHCNFTTTEPINAISNSMEVSWLIDLWWCAFTNQRHRQGICKVGRSTCNSQGSFCACIQPMRDDITL